MNRLQLFQLLRRHNKLNNRRNPSFEQSKIAKFMLMLAAGIMAIYLLMIGIGMAMMANEEGEPAGLFIVLPIFLLIDFFLRFIFQHTPAMLVKPYLLLPLPRKSVIELFLVNSVTSSYNLMWLFMFLPYTYLVLLGGAQLGVALVILFSGMALILINSQWYLLVRTLINRSLLWWLLPLAVNAAYFLPLFLASDTAREDVAYAVIDGFSSWWSLLLCLLVLAGMLWLNRALQFHYMYEEIAQDEKKPAAMKSVSRFAFLERFGQTGEYLKLELKSCMRNKAVRTRVVMSLGLIVMLSLIITYTDIYDSPLMLNFWCYYCFGIYGMTALVKIMAPEGNYIDLLMTQRENILLLLKAKYYFYVSVLFIPLLIMLPAIIAGKFPLLMVVAFFLISSGMLYFMLFQLAVYNKQTLPLDQKITGKANVENGLQMVIEMAAMLLPMLLVGVMVATLEEQTAYVVLSLIGLAFTLAHPLWLRNIYNRMMQRKYANLNGFHASR